jgi:hypothetical protein
VPPLTEAAHAAGWVDHGEGPDLDCVAEIGPLRC